MKIIFVIRPTVVEVQLAIIGHAATLSTLRSSVPRGQPSLALPKGGGHASGHCGGCARRAVILDEVVREAV
jgi:hypothetical protein